MPLTFNFGEENNPERFRGKPKTPVTLISGFLGTGKTTLLKNLLENQDGVRIGVVVNDVAAVNIDSQLVRRYETGLVEVTELQNGCVCCSSADDLFSAVQNVVMRSQHTPFEHIVVELSGVGEPDAVKRNWTIGLECTMPVALRTEIKRVVTVVDASTFGQDWLDTRQAQERNEQVHGDKHDEKNKVKYQNVGQLLAEQVEWADVVVVNKTDLASAEELGTTLEVVRALNEKAPMHNASFGKIAPALVLPPVPKGLKTAAAGEGQGFTWRQTAESITVRLGIGADVKGKDVDFKVARQSLKLAVKGRQEPRVEGKLFAELKSLDDVMFEIDGSGAERCVAVTLEKRRAEMWEGLLVVAPRAGAGGGSGGPHGPEDDEVLDICLPTAGQGSQPLLPNRAESRFGIRSFVFQRRRPFSQLRLEALLKAWPIPRKELFGVEDLEPGLGCSEPLHLTLQPVLRSKGFCWVDAEPLRQHVWAHAGKTLAVNPADWWWAALDKEQLKFKVTYPGVEAEYKAARREKWDQDVGDRRQELVFIGGPRMCEEDIVTLLDGCLLTDAELEEYSERVRPLQVPNDDFHVNGLLKNLGATPEQIQEMDSKAAERQEEARLGRKKDREETDFLRSLGVGCDLESPEEQDQFEAID